MPGLTAVCLLPVTDGAVKADLPARDLASSHHRSQDLGILPRKPIATATAVATLDGGVTRCPAELTPLGLILRPWNLL